MRVYEVIEKLPLKCQVDLEKLHSSRKVSERLPEKLAQGVLDEINNKTLGYMDCLVSLGLVEEKCRVPLLRYYFSIEDSAEKRLAEIK